MSSYDAFALIYDAWAADMTDDIDYYVELARAADGPIVELAVGSGRVAIPIAERTPGSAWSGSTPRRPCSPLRGTERPPQARTSIFEKAT